MELRTAFLPQLEVRQPQLTGFFPRRLTMKRELETPVVVAVSNSNRDTFPTSHCGWKHLEVHSNDHQRVRHLPLPKVESPKGPELSFIRLQPTDQETAGLYMRKFGRFVAREALLDEEIWEFYALKRRCSGQDGNSLKCFCFVAVKKEEKNVRRTVINSVVGTLDLSVRQFVQGETYPGEVNRVSPVLVRHDPFDRHKYAYISNVCVAKYARRQGIASNLLYLATEVATTTGLKQLFVHVNADNKPAQELYEKTGFKIVEASASTLSKDQRLLMSIDL